MKIIHVVNDKGGDKVLPRLLTFQQVQEYLQIGKDSLLNLLHTGKLKGFKIKGRWRISENDLKEYIDSLREQQVV